MIGKKPGKGWMLNKEWVPTVLFEALNLQIRITAAWSESELSFSIFGSATLVKIPMWDL